MKCNIMFSVGLLFSSFVFVEQAYASVKPEKCPEAGYIIASGLSKVRSDPFGWGLWTGEQRNKNYNTEILWNLVIGTTPAGSSVHAMEKLTNALETITFRNGPVENENYWICQYSTTTNNVGVDVYTNKT